MKTKSLFSIILVILEINLLGQNHYYDLQPKVPANYFFDAEQKYKEYLTVKDSALKSKDNKEYAEVLAYYHQTMLHSGLVYFNWSEIETYLEKLLNKIKTTYNITKDLKIFLVRDEDNNASAFDNGIIYVDIGLLANAPDEASLVSVLGHEISHAINNDQKKTYQSETRQKKNSLKSALVTSHGNRMFEARADNYGFKLATGLGYDIRSEYSAIIKFESDYRWYKSQYSYDNPKWLIYVDKFDKENNVPVDSLEDLLSSHPENFKRIDALKKFVSQKNGDKKFIENENLFNTISQKAKIEQLYINFTEGSYLDCLKNAFYYHLLDQKNPDYLYYTCESLRRLLLIDPKLYKKGFLTQDSKDPVFEKNKGILRDISYLSLDTVFIARIANDTLYGKHVKPFETYLQAYNFLVKKAEAINVKDIALTKALFNLVEGDTAKANTNLKKYLQNPGQGYKEYATKLLAGNLFEGFTDYKKNLIYVTEPNYFYRKEGNGQEGKINYSFIESRNAIAKVKEIFNDPMVVDKQNTAVFYEDSLNIVDNNFYAGLFDHLTTFKTEKEAQNDYVSLKSFQDKDYWNARAAQNPKDPEVLEKQKNFFYLDPEYWKFFKEQAAAGVIKIEPFLYNIKTPTGSKTYFFLDLSYFDPYNKKYIYYDQEYLEKFTKENVKKVLKKFTEKINFKG